MQRSPSLGVDSRTYAADPFLTHSCPPLDVPANKQNHKTKQNMQDPLALNIPLANVETTLPLLPEGDYVFQVTEASADPNKDKNGLNLNLTLALQSPVTAVDGREIPVNHKVYATYALQAREDSTDKEAYQRALGDVLDALFLTDKSNRPALTHPLIQDMVGKSVLATVYLNEWPEGSGNKNNKVRRLKRVA